MAKINIFIAPYGEESHHKYHTLLERKFKHRLNSFINFLQNEIVTSLLLLIVTIIAVAWASSPQYSKYYSQFQHFSLGVNLGHVEIRLTLQEFVNNFLMSLFFFLLGLEVKKEMLAGEFRKKKIKITVFGAALGGIIAPALIFLFLTDKASEIQGWGVPIATDSAFALGILAFFRKRLPENLFTFVAAFAVIDDLVAIAILAIYYTPHISLHYVFYGLSIMACLLFFNMLGIRRYLPYLILGTILWWAIEGMGLHGTLTGIITALAIPTRPQSGPKRMLNEMTRLEKHLKKQTNEALLADKKKQLAIERIESLAIKTTPPSMRIHHQIEPIIMLIILPLFALMNAGIPLHLKDIIQSIHCGLPSHIFHSLLIGKFIGISVVTYLLCFFKIGALPKGINFGHIIGVALLAGIGFTMSLYISESAFDQAPTILAAKLGIFIASILACSLAIIYFIWFTRYYPASFNKMSG